MPGRSMPSGLQSYGPDRRQPQTPKPRLSLLGPAEDDGTTWLRVYLWRHEPGFGSCESSSGCRQWSPMADTRLRDDTSILLVAWLAVTHRHVVLHLRLISDPRPPGSELRFARKVEQISSSHLPCPVIQNLDYPRKSLSTFETRLLACTRAPAAESLLAVITVNSCQGPSRPSLRCSS